MFKKKDYTNIFQIKPGYKAIESQSSSTTKLYKKKILTRESATSLFYFISPNDSIIGGAVSYNNKSGKWYIKSFAINKFSVAIKASREHYQIPTKLLRELQAIAIKRKNLPPVTKNYNTS